jgi:hypothetical protein
MARRARTGVLLCTLCVALLVADWAFYDQTRNSNAPKPQMMNYTEASLQVKVGSEPSPQPFVSPDPVLIPSPPVTATAVLNVESAPRKLVGNLAWVRAYILSFFHKVMHRKRVDTTVRLHSMFPTYTQVNMNWMPCATILNFGL